MRERVPALTTARTIWGVCAFFLCSLVVACGRQASPDNPTTAPPAPAITTATSTTLSAAEIASQQAIASYLGMWQAMARAAQTSDWKASELARFATDNALTTITRSLFADHENHVVTKGSPVNAPKVSNLDPPENPETIRISDCGDSTNWLKYKEGTDQLKDDTPGGHRSIIAEAKKQPDGTWKVTQFAVQGLGSC